MIEVTGVFNSFYAKLDKVNKEKYKILFEPKDDWFTTEEDGEQNWYPKNLNNFYQVLKNFIEIQENETMCNLSLMVFPLIKIKNISEHFIQEVSFLNATFIGKIDFSNVTFYGNAKFDGTNFKNTVTFHNSIFANQTNFKDAIFENEAIFDEAIFEKKVSFWGAKFKNKIHFDSTVSKDTFNFTKVSFNFITLKNTNIDNGSFLEITGLDKTGKETIINKDNFANKESARLIKAHFEKQGNITEANKYFVIEQEKYISDLRNGNFKNEDKRITKLIPLWLNKVVSNFGTDWIRASLFLLLFGIVSYSFLNLLKFKSNVSFDIGLFIAFVATSMGYRMTYIKTKLKIKEALFVIITFALYFIWGFGLAGIEDLNTITKLINPINAFKDDDIELKQFQPFHLTLVLIGAAVIIYQIIISFRQFTRRA